MSFCKITDSMAVNRVEWKNKIKKVALNRGVSQCRRRVCVFLASQRVTIYTMYRILFYWWFRWWLTNPQCLVHKEHTHFYQLSIEFGPMYHILGGEKSSFLHTCTQWERCISVLHCFLVGSLVLHLSEFFSSFFFLKWGVFREELFYCPQIDGTMCRWWW